MKNNSIQTVIEDNEEKMYNFLDYVEKEKRNLTIIVAIRDTPGNNLSENIIVKLHQIGFKTFSKELWKMYIGVLDRGETVLDYSSPEREDTIKYSCNLNGHDIKIHSSSWRQENYASIMINKIEYAVNMRGINIVAYNSITGEVCASIAYDAHDEKIRYKEEELLRQKNAIEWLNKKKHFDIMLMGAFYGANYGSTLNGYAEYKTLKKMGKTVLMLSAPGFPLEHPELDANMHNVKFIHKYFNNEDLSPVFNLKELDILNDYADIFATGSDQLWRWPISFWGTMYQGFVHDNKKKISLATSCGSMNDEVPDSKKQYVEECLKKFDAISVREEFSKTLLHKKYGVLAHTILEPVFWLDKKEYANLVADSSINNSGKKYILAYILDPNDKKLSFLNEIAEKLKMDVITIPDGQYSVMKTTWDKNDYINKYPNCIPHTEVVDFLKLFSDSSFIVTDSFHGCCFSIIFERKFLAISNSLRGKDRFNYLLKLFSLENRLIEDNSLIYNNKYEQDIDYVNIKEIIKTERKKTFDWITDILNRPKRKKFFLHSESKNNINLLHSNPEFIKIRLLATLLRDYGIKHIVLSPGGRDVPLVRMFEYNHEHFILHQVTDERSAGYYALGLATQLRQPVACVCTSGTAASNYLPAITEAYYTGIPLIMITADRYNVYLNHGEDQTIPQKHLYQGVIKKEVSLSEATGWRAEYQTRRDISDCILEATHNGFGPVHINIPIDNIGIGANVSKECWNLLPFIHPHILRVNFTEGQTDMLRWVDSLKKSQKILIVYGQNAPITEKQKSNIELFASRYNCVIVTDFIANLDCKYNLQPYNMLQAISQDDFNKELSPDILITVGGKRLMNDPLTFKIRGGLGNIRHWHVAPDGKVKDFYFRLTSVIESTQDYFFEWFSEKAEDGVNNGVYYEKWRSLAEKYNSPETPNFNAHYIQNNFIPKIPSNSLLHLGVGQSFYDCRRYKMNKNVEVYCNMGTNGIDGCTSTFMGQCAVAQNKLCFLLVGDLSFFYDMNGIWNKPLKPNMRILLVNNNGSGLLRGNNLKAVTASHNTKAEGWVKSTGFEYICASSKEEFDKLLLTFMSEKSEKAIFFEVFCE